MGSFILLKGEERGSFGGEWEERGSVLLIFFSSEGERVKKLNGKKFLRFSVSFIFSVLCLLCTYKFHCIL